MLILLEVYPGLEVVLFAIWIFPNIAGGLPHGFNEWILLGVIFLGRRAGGEGKENSSEEYQGVFELHIYNGIDN